MILSGTVYASDIKTIYDLNETTRLSSGTTYESIKKLTPEGWMNINVVRADLTDEYTKTAPLYNTSGMSIKTPLSSMMSKLNAIAGVNGDFFIMDGIAQTYGPIINNGEIVTSPYPPSEKYPTLSYLQDGTIDVSVWNPTVYIKNSQGQALYTPLINKGSSIKYNAVLLNKYYGKKSPGNTIKNIVEVVIKNNIVQEIRENLPPVQIPDDGYIISCASNQKSTVKNMFKVGENVKMTFKFDFDLDKLNWAVGGVNYLVKDGKINDIHTGVLGRHPRTAVGFNKDNTEIIFVTVDGRNKSFIGATQTELAQIMVELGAYNVINMDGGGSTTMGIDFLKNGDIDVVNIPSDGKERPISAGLGIFTTATNDDIVNTIELVPQYEKIFNNTSVELNIKAFNKYYSEISVDNSEVSYSVDSKMGTIKDGIFTPSAPGTATITATIGDKKATYDILVLDTPVALSMEEEDIMLLSGETYKFDNVMGIDADGRSAYISSDNLTFKITNSIGKVNDGIFTASDTVNTGAVTIKCGDATKNVKMKVGYKGITIQSFESSEDLTFSTYPLNSNGKIEILDEKIKERNYALKLSYDFTNMTDQSIAFVNLGKDEEGILLKGNPLAIGMWVYGDNSNHWLRTRVQDATGRTYKIDFAEEVNWSGWKFVTAELPQDIAYPVRVKNLYIAEISEARKDTGAIYIDCLRGLYEPNDKNLRLPEESSFTDALKKEKDTEYDEKLTVEGNKITKDKKNEDTESNIIYLSANIKYGKIDYHNTELWNEIINLQQYKDKTIVLVLNKQLNNIVDKRERNVIQEILDKTALNNKVFVICQENSENTKIIDNIRYIQYDDKFELYKTSDSIHYNN